MRLTHHNYVFQLYPFGLDYNDRLMPQSDTVTSTVILLSDDFIFFNKRIKKIYVSICIKYVCTYVCV